MTIELLLPPDSVAPLDAHLQSWTTVPRTTP
jgi:hypothetical protein